MSNGFRDREVAAVQNSSEWFKCRAGCITASNLNRLVEYDADSGIYVASLLKTGKNKGNRKKEAADYLINVMAERMTGNAAENYVSFFMDRGRELEPEARKTYMLRHNVVVETVGFVLHESIQWFGASPDGVIEEQAGFEVKCPSSSTHLEYLMGRCETLQGVPVEYLAQLDAGMSVLGLSEWRFASYSELFPRELQLYTTVLKRDEKRIASLEQCVVKALQEVEQQMEALKQWQKERKHSLAVDLVGGK